MSASISSGQADGSNTPGLAACGFSGSGRTTQLRKWLQRPLCAGLLVGGQSARMGQPKALLDFHGKTLGEIAARALSDGLEAQRSREGAAPRRANLLLLGGGVVPPALKALPRLDDVPGVSGPLAGVLAAHRWAPLAAWVVAACDHPWLSGEDIRGLISQRRPGVWAILAMQSDHRPCPTLALYEPQALAVLERALRAQGSAARLAELIDHPRTIVCLLGARGTVNVNTPAELATADAQDKAERKI